VETDAKNSNN